MKTQRLLLTLFYIMKRGKTSTSELADYLDISKRTVYRDIDELRTAGVEIESMPGAGGGHRLADGFKLDELLFSKRDLSSIMLGSKTLSQFADTEFSEDAGILYRKIEGLNKGASNSDSSAEKMLIDWQYSFHGNDYNQTLARLEKAVNEEETVHIRYNSPICEMMSTSGLVEPYGLVNKVGYWYLAGFCHELKIYRAMNIAFMESLLLTGRHFKRNPGFNLSEFWKNQKSR